MKGMISKEATERFHYLRDLHHPNINPTSIEMHTHGKAKVVAVISQYREGGSLQAEIDKRKMENNPLDEQECLCWFV